LKLWRNSIDGVKTCVKIVDFWTLCKIQDGTGHMSVNWSSSVLVTTPDILWLGAAQRAPILRVWR